MPSKQWFINKRLRKFGDAYAKCEDDIYQRLKKMPDAELRRVLEDVATLTGTNVGWATYRARNIVKELAEHILYVRSKDGRATLPVALQSEINAEPSP